MERRSINPMLLLLHIFSSSKKRCYRWSQTRKFTMRLIASQGGGPYIIASFSAQWMQVYCLVEMAPFAPSRRPPRHRNEFNGFPGRREWPNQCRHTTIVSGLSTHPTLRRDRKRRIAPSDPSLNQPSRQHLAACPDRPKFEQKLSWTSTTASTLNPKNGRTTELILHRPSKLCWKIMNWIAQNLSFQNPKWKMGCLVLILQQIKQKHSKLLREKSSEATTEEEQHHQIHHWSNQATKIKKRVPRRQNGGKLSLIPTSVSTLNPEDDRTQPNVPSSIEIHNRN